MQSAIINEMSNYSDINKNLYKTHDGGWNTANMVGVN